MAGQGKQFKSKGNIGRPKGAKGKTAQAAGQMVLDALDKLGGVKYLIGLGENPKTQGLYASLLSRILPRDMSIAHSGQSVEEFLAGLRGKDKPEKSRLTALPHEGSSLLGDPDEPEKPE